MKCGRRWRSTRRRQSSGNGWSRFRRFRRRTNGRFVLALHFRSAQLCTVKESERNAIASFRAANSRSQSSVGRKTGSLRFTIAEAPVLMEEWSPYGHIRTRHIEEHYFRAHDAEFTLAPLPGGRTLLTGLSRYENHMWPAAYWRLWTDAIVHNIHVRVFRFVKQTAEADQLRMAAQ